MKKKIILLSSVILLSALTLTYFKFNYLIAGEDGKNCNTTSCTDKSKITSASELDSYEFTTDKACCDQMKNELKAGLTGLNGVKEVKFSTTCGVSKMTNVTVYYENTLTSTDAIVKFVKEKEFDCSKMPGCEDAPGCEKDKSGNCPSKHKKSTDKRDI